MRYFKQKAAQNDFHPDDLPRNRKEQFLAILKNDLTNLLLLGLIIFVFYLPMLVLDIVRLNIMDGIIANLTGDEQVAMLQITQLVYGAVAIICLLILAIGLSGVFGVMKRLIWGQPIFLFDDFKKGIKANIGSFILIILFGGAISYLLMVITVLNPTNLVLEILTYGVNMAIVIPFCLEMMFIVTFYQNKFSKTLTNGAVLYLKTFLFLISTVAMIYLFYLINLIPFPVIAALVKALFIIVFLPIILLYGFAGQIAKFDQLINQIHYPHVAFKGLNIGSSPKENK